MGRRPFASPCRTTERSDDRISVNGSKRRTNVQRKISISAFLLCTLKFITELPTPSNGEDTNITRGLPSVSTSLDILLTRPLRTLETRGAKYGHKTLSKIGRTSRPYAPIAMVSLFTKKITLNAPRVSSFDVCLLKKDSERFACRISPKGEAVRLPKLIERLESPLRYQNKNLRCSCRLHRPHR